MLPPLVTPALYRVQSERRSVVFVNPHPVKGVEIAFALARRRPDIPFEFVESWELAAVSRRALLKEAARLPNVHLRKWGLDMKPVYLVAKLILAPSRWEEGWGRVVSEAQVSGIPALASRRGGLPEAVGPGGILVDPDAELTEWEQGAGDAVGQLLGLPVAGRRRRRARRPHELSGGRRHLGLHRYRPGSVRAFMMIGLSLEGQARCRREERRRR